MPYSERVAIEDQLRTNRNLMEELRKENMEFIIRLREIDNRDFGNSGGSNEMADNLSRIIDKLSDLIPEIPADVMINKLKEKYDSENVKEAIVSAPAAEEEADPTEEKLKNDRVEKQLNSKPGAQMSKEKSSSIVKDILMNAARPMQVKEIQKEFEKQTGKHYKVFGKKVKDAMEVFPTVKKAKTLGWYEYQEAEKEPQRLEAVR